MPFQDAGALRYFTFDSLNNSPVTHAVFTRRGGVSREPYAQLNVGATVGDERVLVDENLARAFAAVGRERNSLFDSWLVHSTHALIANAPRPPEWEKPPQADIILTNKSEVTLFMRYADCVPIILYDPIRRAVGLVHAGWRGTMENVAAKAIERMQTEYGSRAQDILACIGPAICADHYQVGSDVEIRARETFGEKAAPLLRRLNGSVHFDLAGANRFALEEAGVHDIEDCAICTAEHTEDWFSHRASGGRTGRFGALIALKSL